MIFEANKAQEDNNVPLFPSYDNKFMDLPFVPNVSETSSSSEDIQPGTFSQGYWVPNTYTRIRDMHTYSACYIVQWHNYFIISLGKFPNRRRAS